MGKNIVALMLQEYENFTRSERKIVDYVLEHQTETQYISITDLSAVCEVAVSTISVFCRKMKLAGFNDFKLELARASLLAAPDMGQSAAGEVLPGDSTGAVMSKVLRSAQDTLGKAYHMLAEPSVTQAVDLLLAARQVLCLGQGNHSVVSLAAWAQFSTTSPKFKTIQDSHMQIVTLSTLSREDVVLYFSYSGATRDMLEIVQLAKERKVKIILVTRFPKSPGAALADVVLQCGANESPIQMGSIAARIAMIFVVDMIFSEVCRRDLETCQTHRRMLADALAEKHL